MPNTVLARINIDGGWSDYIHEADYTDNQNDAMGDALLAAQETEFDALLPEDCQWFRHTGEIIGPAGTELPSDLDELMREACEAVIAQYETIEAAVLGETDTQR